MAIDPSDTNGRVSLAVIRRDLDEVKVAINNLVQEIREDRRCTEDRLRTLETAGMSRQERIETLREEVKSLRAKSDAWNLTNTAGAIIAGILGAIGMGK